MVKGETYIIDYEPYIGKRRFRRVIYIEHLSEEYIHVISIDRLSVILEKSRIHTVTRECAEYARNRENPLS